MCLSKIMASHTNRIYICTVYFLALLTGSLCSETTMGGDASDNKTCHLHALNEELLQATIHQIKEKGTHSLEYHLTFPNYKHGNPLLNNTRSAYEPHKWQRVFTKQGETLLSLPFDYGALSLTLLSFGAEGKLDIELADLPEGCLAAHTEEFKMDAVKHLLTLNFRAHLDQTEWASRDKVCHQVVTAYFDNALFQDECCSYSQYAPGFSCEIMETNKWIDYLYTVINIMDVVFFLIGPIIAQKMFASNSYRITQYIVKLVDPHVCYLRKAKDDASKSAEEFLMIEPGANTNNSNGDSESTTDGGDNRVIDSTDDPEKEESTPLRVRVVDDTPRGDTQTLPHMYADCLEKLPYNVTQKVEMSTLYIQVDHRRLMAEEEVNVGMFRFLWQNIVICKLTKAFPFVACCEQSIFGTWRASYVAWKSPSNSISNFCLKLNVRFGRRLTWKSIFRVVGLLIAVAIIPLPFYIRIAIYDHFQGSEHTKRAAYADKLGLGHMSRSVFQHEVNTLYILFIISLVIYFLSSLILLVIYRLDKMRFGEHITQILQDLKHIERLESLRLFSMHFIKPFEIFGVLGIIIAPVYWIIALPISAIIAIFYCIPTFYLIGRFLFNSEMLSVLYPKRIGTLELSARALSDIFMTRYISPPSDHAMMIRPMKIDGKWSGRVKPEYCWKMHLAIGLLLCSWMVSLLLLYAECFRFLFEVMSLTLMGALVNAGSAGQYFMLAFFLVTYIIDVFNNTKSKYLKLSAKVFEYIKTKLDSRVVTVIRLRGSEQKNVAFKFFTNSELEQIYSARDKSDISTYDAEKVTQDFILSHKDRFDFVKDTLSWRLSSLIYFIDKHDQPRIPRALFETICDLRLDGLPGPVHENLLIALRQLLYMVLMLLFVFLVVLAFGDSYDLSTTNQLLLTLVGGLVPFLVIRVMKPKAAELNLNTYSFQGKIYEIIHSFQQFWPAYDMAFELSNESASHELETVTIETEPTLRAVDTLELQAAPPSAEAPDEDGKLKRQSPARDRVCGVSLENCGDNLVFHVRNVDPNDATDPVDDCVVS